MSRMNRMHLAHTLAALVGVAIVLALKWVSEAL